MIANPAGIIFSHPLVPLRPCTWDRTKSSRQGLGPAGFHPIPSDFQIVHRLADAAAAQRIFGIGRIAPRSVIRQRNRVESHRRAGLRSQKRRQPRAIADHIDPLDILAHPHAHAAFIVAATASVMRRADHDKFAPRLMRHIVSRIGKASGGVFMRQIATRNHRLFCT